MQILKFKLITKSHLKVDLNPLLEASLWKLCPVEANILVLEFEDGLHCFLWSYVLLNDTFFS